MSSHQSIYAGAQGDTNFRRKWTQEELDERKQRKITEQEEIKEKAKEREDAIDFDAYVNKIQVVQAVSSAGFHCRLCDRIFRDNMAYLEHINSPEHQRNKGLSTKFARANLQDVRDRLAMLKRRRDVGRSAEDIEKAILTAREVHRREAEEQKQRRKEAKKRRQQKQKQTTSRIISDTEEASAVVSEEQMAMSALMGFSGFGSTAK